MWRSFVRRRVMLVWLDCLAFEWMNLSFSTAITIQCSNVFVYFYFNASLVADKMPPVHVPTKRRLMKYKYCTPIRPDEVPFVVFCDWCNIRLIYINLVFAFHQNRRRSFLVLCLWYFIDPSFLLTNITLKCMYLLTSRLTQSLLNDWKNSIGGLCSFLLKHRIYLGKKYIDIRLNFITTLRAQEFSFQIEQTRKHDIMMFESTFETKENEEITHV